MDVRAVYNEKEIGFLIEWDDPFQDNEHHRNRGVKTFKNRFVKAVGEIPREPGIFRDSIALQFPVKPTLKRRIPFFRGDSNNPVNLWGWKSDAEAGGGTPVEDNNALGIRSPISKQSEGEQRVRGKGFWKDGRWHVVMIRTLQAEDEDDIQFAKDRIIHIAFNVWDGSNGEHGLIMGLSTWRLVYLDVPPSNHFRRG